MKTVLITGCSSGIGKAAATLFAAKNWNVIATLRSPEKETGGASVPASRAERLVSSLVPPEKRVAAERAQTVSLPDYDRFIARIGAAYAGMSAKHMATADEIAQVIYGAATDGTNRLRYFCGEDTGGLVKARRDLPEEKFLDLMSSRFSTGNQ